VTFNAASQDTRDARLAAANPASVLRTRDGKLVELKCHRALWSGDFPENSLAAVDECYRERVAHAEIDIYALVDTDFVVLHDEEISTSATGSGRVHDLRRADVKSLKLRVNGATTAHRPPLLSEVVLAIADQPFRTLLELDLPAFEPIPWGRVEEFIGLVEPIRDCIHLNGADWNIRRFLEVDSTLPVGCGPEIYLDWVPEGMEAAEAWATNSTRTAYGYLDQHPLALKRSTTAADYLYNRLSGIVHLVPGASEIHVRVELFEQMLRDGFTDLTAFLHEQSLLVDVWTLNADSPGWEARLQRLVDAGVDIISTDTPRLLASSWQQAPLSAG
jgi:glycerophosphoryl diester phosphodiesterase